jgi:putative ABC transport system ATP-binding protein
VRALEDVNLAKGSELYPIRRLVVSFLLFLLSCCLTLPLCRGEFVMLRGPSGGGKTSLLNILGTIDKCTSGSISLLGHEIDENSSDEFLARLRLEKIGFVFQTFNLLATMSAFENVELPMIMLGKLDAKQRKKKAKKLLKCK